MGVILSALAVALSMPHVVAILHEVRRPKS